MKKYSSSFYFKGARTYVQGPTILENFRKVAIDAHGFPITEMKIKNFKVGRYIEQNSTIKVFNKLELEDNRHKENILAEMFCSTGEQTYFIGLYSEDLTPIEKRVEFNEKQYIGSIDLLKPFSGTAELIKIATHYDLIQAIVEANKQIHLLTLPKTDQSYRIKFAALSGYYYFSEIYGSTARLKIENAGIQENELHKLTLNRFKLNLHDREINFQMCYSFLKL